MSAHSAEIPEKPGVTATPGLRRTTGLVLLALPLALLAGSLLPTPVVLRVALQAIGGFTLAVAPGYALLRAVSSDPLDTEAPDYSWPLIVPLSLAVDVSIGLLLVLSPIGLSAGSIWAALCIVSLGSLMVARKL